MSLETRGGAGAVSQATPDAPDTNAPNGTKARAAYQLFDLLSPDEFHELKEDIARRGVLVPVEYDEHGVLLDGHHRVRACDDLGLQDYPRVIRVGLSDEEKEEHVVTLNLRRRHLNGEQKRRWIGWFLERHPEWSDRRIAAEVGVHHATVASERTEVVDKLSTRVGRDGVTQPARKPVVRVDTPREQERAQSALSLAPVLDDRPMNLHGLEKAAGIRQMRREEIIVSRNPQLAEGPWQVLLADPPWRYEHVETDSRAIENQYPTLSLDEICALPIASHATPDSLLFLWATSPKLEEAIRVINAWGFTYRTNLVWVKDKIGMGYYARQQHELLLVARRGNFPVPPESARPSSVFQAPRGEHSTKPVLVYELIERMYPSASRVELFARNTREGWHSWGNQVD